LEKNNRQRQKPSIKISKAPHLRLDVFQQLSLPSDILETEETNKPTNQPKKQTKQTNKTKPNKQNAVVFCHWILLFCFCWRQ